MFRYQNGQVIDHDRGYKLVKRSGGSGGTEFFRLSGPRGEWHFTSYLQLSSEVQQEELTNLGLPTDAVAWVRVVSIESDFWEPLVRESIVAHDRGLIDQARATALPPVRADWEKTVVLLRAGSSGALTLP